MLRNSTPLILILLTTLLTRSTPGADRPAKEEKSDQAPAVRFDPVVQKIEGWTVDVEPALLEGEHADAGGRALRMLADHLNRISILVPEDRLKDLQTVEIWIEYQHPTLAAMQYHPGRGWLVEHGCDPRLTRKVHIPRAEDLIARRQLVKHPMVVLHELAHAYHDQFLSFDDPRIIEAYDAAKESGKYDDVLVYTGERERHYGMTNHKEYFAESTEAYFGRNDFYPFVRAELQEYDPVMYELLVEIWGPLQ